MFWNGGTMAKVPDYPIYGTEHGGKVRPVGDGFSYVFIEKPDLPNFEVGDTMPPQWATFPINEEAREERVLNLRMSIPC